jgi:hypothetical protein
MELVRWFDKICLIVWALLFADRRTDLTKLKTRFDFLNAPRKYDMVRDVTRMVNQEILVESSDWKT